MSKPRRQHWVPRIYLRSFATPDTIGKENPDVWLFHKEAGDPFRTSISNVAAESFLYSPQTANGERDFGIEDQLANLESSIAPLWRRFANEFVDLKNPIVRKGLGLFLSTLFHRNPQRIDDHAKILSEIKSGSKQDFRTVAKDNLHKSIREKFKSEFVQTLLTESIPTAEQIMKKRWAVVVSNEPVFATSDHPFMVMHEDLLLRNLGFFGGTILVPVSPIRMMIIDDNHAEGNNYYELQRDTLGAFHAVVLRQALRFLISSCASDEVLCEIAKVSDGLGIEN
jgi:hypothetical protein